MRKAAAVLFLIGLKAAVAFGQPTKHRTGPAGLAGWLVRQTVETLESQGPLPTSLVIARNGKVIRRLDGLPDPNHVTASNGPFLWNFIFLNDGKRIAFEHGSLHFNMACTLMDIKSGKHIEDYDCWQELPADAPQWVRTLESAPQLD